MLIGGPPPWHLWGNTQVLTLPPVGALGVTSLVFQQNTMVRASYSRPESWRFLFHMETLSGGQEPTPDPVDPSGLRPTITLSFDLIVGIGRSAFKIPGFVTLLYEWGSLPGQTMNIGTVFWTANAFPFPEATTGDPTEQTPIDVFVAQDVTIVCNAQFLTPYLTTVTPVRVSASCHIAPNTHVRPDWMLQGKHLAEQFPGGEIGGR